MKIAMRTISVSMAVIFIWHQVAWAGELFERLSDTTSTSGMTSARLRAAQAAAESVVMAKEAAESMPLISGATVLQTRHGVVYDRTEAKSDGWTYYYTNYRICEKTHPDGRAYLYEYTQAGKYSKVTCYTTGNAFYSTAVYQYDVIGSSTGRSVSYASGVVEEYNAAGQRTRYTYASGSYNLYAYDASGKARTVTLYASTGALTSATTYCYDTAGVRTGWVTSYPGGAANHYNAQGQLTIKVLANGTYSVYTYNANGKTGTVTYYTASGVLSSIQVYRYDGSGNYTGKAISYPSGVAEEYNAKGQRVTYTSAGGARTVYTYDAAGAKTGWVTAYPGGQVNYYDALGRLVKQVLATGYYYIYKNFESHNKATIVEYWTAQHARSYTAAYSYDASGVFAGKTVTYATGAIEEYNAKSQRITAISASGDRTVYSYYADGRKNAEQRYSSAGAWISTSVYYDDASGRLRERILAAPDAQGMVYYRYLNENWASRGYGRADRASMAIANERGELSFTYVYHTDAAGCLSAKQSYAKADFTGPVAMYRYTDSGRLFERSLSDGTLYQYQDGSDADPLRKINPDGSYTEYFYDPEGTLDCYQEYSTNGAMTICDKGHNVIYAYRADDPSKLRNPPSDISVTTSAGDVIAYNDGAIVSITLKSDGAMITAIELGVDGSLKNAIVLYPDGAVGVVYNGKLIQTSYASGAIIRYRDGRVSTDYSARAGIASYVYHSQDGRVVDSILARTKSALCEYGPDGTPMRFVKENGDSVLYENGRIKEIALMSGARYAYSFIGAPSPRSTLIGTTTDDTIPVSIYYDADGHIVTVCNSRGDRLDYMDGLPHAVTCNGTTISYAYSLGTHSDIERIIVDCQGIKQAYDTYGDLSSLTGNGITMTFAKGAVVRIAGDSGEVIEKVVLDPDNAIISATVAKPDGTKVVYDEGVIREIDNPDGSKLYYGGDGNITSSLSSSGTVYSYARIEEDGVTYLIASASDPDAIADPDAVLYQKFDSANTLMLAKKKDGTTIRFSYIRDASGNITRTMADDGKSITTYDANDTIMTVKTAATPADPLPTTAYYGGNRIRTVYHGDTLIYTYSYEYDTDGKEVTVIRDVTTGDAKRYTGGILASVTDAKNIVTSYEYDGEGRIRKATVTTLNQIVNIYSYTYSDDRTIIEDMDGIVRTYDTDNRLTRLEQNGQTYDYTYRRQSDGTETVIQDLSMVRDNCGVITRYAHGAIQSIVSPDGTVITDVALSGETVAGYAVKKDGVAYYISNDKVIKEVRSDGTIIHYNEDGTIASVADNAGNSTRYSYTYSGSGELAYIAAAKNGLTYTFDANGTFVETSDADGNRYLYDSAGRLTRVITASKQECDLSYTDNVISISSSARIALTSASDSAQCSVSNLSSANANGTSEVELYREYDFDYGDGSDGDLRVEAGQRVVIDGTRNYSSLYVAPGAVLTVAPWDGISGGAIEIKCTGNVDIEGVIEADGDGYSGGSGASGFSNTATSGESYAGSSCRNGINNYGGGGAGQVFGLNGNTIVSAGGAGGSYGTAGTSGFALQAQPSRPGDIYGDPYLTNLYRGSGGGGGVLGGSLGGNGGGIIKIAARSITVAGSVSANGADGGASFGGGGSGGSIWLIADEISVPGAISAHGGMGGVYNGYSGGSGGDGRIRIDCTTFTGNAPAGNPYMYQIQYWPNGTLVSKPVAVVTSEFGHIAADTHMPAGTHIAFLTRTGAGADVHDGTWSDWTEATPDGAGYKVQSPINKHIQYEAVFTTSDASKTPSLSFSGGCAIALDYSYAKSFNATAPPDDMPFRNLLTLAPNLPISPSSATVMSAFSQVGQLTSRVMDSVLPGDTVIETQTCQTKVVSKITMSDGTQVTYFNDRPVSVTKPDGTKMGAFDEDAYMPDRVAGAIEYKKAEVALNISKDSKITTIIDGKPVSVYSRGEDGNVTLLTRYNYDENEDLVSISMPYARDSLASQTAQARYQIAQERVSYLAGLAAQKGIITTTIQAQFAEAYSQIHAERAQLMGRLYQEVTQQEWVGWWIFGWWKTYTVTVEVPQVRAALDQLDAQESQLRAQEADFYAQLNSQIQAAEERLHVEEDAALAVMQDEQDKVEAQIVIEETTPVILNYYRKILGRDPSCDEVSQWIGTVRYDSTIDTALLKATLSGLAERAQGETFVLSLQNAISAALYAYVNADAPGRAAILASLGLSVADAAALRTKEDVDAVLSLLKRQTIHFGRSAFVSLQTLLSEHGIVADISDLALKSILIDVFTGSCNALTTTDLLELSMYSLAKTASIFGLSVHSEKLDFDGLTQAYRSGGVVIAHLKNDHYVNVTDIAADGAVTYREHNAGRGGTAYTVSKGDFENSWTGYVIAKSAPADCRKILTDSQAKRVKGSCLPFLFPLIGFIVGAISGVITAAATAISAVISGVSAFLAPIISGIGSLITGIGSFMADISSAIFSTISFVGNSLVPTLGTFFTNIGSYVMSGLSACGGAVGSALGFNDLTAIGVALGKTVVTTALSIGVSRGLDLIGINESSLGLFSSFVSGGISGLSGTFSVMGFIGGGLQGLAIQSIQMIGQKIGLDPALSNLIGCAAAGMIGSAINGVYQPVYDSYGVQVGVNHLFGLDAVSYALKTAILPNVAGNLAYYGVTKLGSMLGVDARLSYLAGIGLRSSLHAGLNGMNPQDMFRNVTNGLLGGVTSIGLQWAYEELGVNPLLGAMTANAIAAGFEAVLNRQNVFLNIGKQFGEGVFAIFGDTGNESWSQAVYISRIQDFTKLVQERGLLEALEVYATSIFHQQAINAIIKNGGILEMVTNRAEVFTDANGIQRKRLYDGYDHKSYIDINMVDNTVIEKKESINGVDVITKQEYGRDSNGNLVIKGRTVEEIFSDNQKRVSTFDEKNNLKDMQIFDAAGNVAYRTLPMTGQSAVVLKDGNIYTYILEDVKSGTKFYVENGEMKFTSLDVLGDDATPTPTYVRDPNKTNLENAEALLDSTFDDINLRFSGEDLFGKSAWEVAMRSILLTSAKFQVTYGDEGSDLLGSLTADENASFMDYARLRIDSLFSPYDYYDIATADELAQWVALKSPSSQYGFSLTAIHGTLPHKDGWADNLNGVKVNGQNFILTANSWNEPGTADYIKGDGLAEYWGGGDKQRFIIDSVKTDIVNGWQEAQARGIPFDVALHSLGTVAGYEAIRELKAERPDITIRNVYMMGSPLRFFFENGKATYDANAFANVTNVVNIYNRGDVMNTLQSGALGAASSNPLLRNIINEQFFGSRPVSGELKDLFSGIRDVSTTVPHGAMWKDPQILQIVEQNGVFTN